MLDGVDAGELCLDDDDFENPQHLEDMVGFARIPNIICAHVYRLPYPAVVLYLYVVFIVGWRIDTLPNSWLQMGDEKIAQNLQMNFRTAQKYLALLVEEGLLLRKSLPTSYGGRNKNYYRPNLDVWQENEEWREQCAVEREQRDRERRELFRL